MNNQNILTAIYYLIGFILLIHGVYQILTTTVDQGQLTYALIEIGVGLILWQQARKMELMNKLLSKSTLTEKDALKIGRKINLSVAKRHGLGR